MATDGARNREDLLSDRRTARKDLATDRAKDREDLLSKIQRPSYSRTNRPETIPRDRGDLLSKIQRP